jgi:NAD(P)-dependent dehydrogenase (short-subunit alcohol dehydrogenase family)
VKNFTGKVAVITGAAGGLGREFAIAAAKLGMKLVLADIEAGSLHSIASDLSKMGVEVLPFLCDVSKEIDVRALADTTLEKYGAVHLVMNNAGVGAGGLIWENTRSDWEWILGVNLWGVIHGIQIFTPLMLNCAIEDPSYEGHFVNTSSFAGLVNAPTLGIYNVSKHAVVSVSESLYQDLKIINAPIGASVLCPFWVPTNIHRSSRNRPDSLLNDRELTSSQQLSQSLTDKAVNSATIDADKVAELTFNAIREKQFYIHTNSSELKNVQIRMEDIIGSRNPIDPYADDPRIKKMLQAKLKNYKLFVERNSSN